MSAAGRNSWTWFGAADRDAPKLFVREKGETATIEIYDPIDDEPFGISAKTFIGEMNALKKKNVRNLEIRINSPGGSVFDSLAIANTVT